MIYVFTFLLAFCSIVYELLLGQSLSAFLGNTVLRYSMTIGLYMLSMGIGSLLAAGRVVKHVVTSLLKVEILLTITGGFSVIILLVMNSIGAPDIVFFLFAHLLIVLIGVLTGLEIPLLIELRNLEVDGSERSVLGVDYLGAFFGTVVFAFLFYPLVGLIPTAFMVALLNAFADGGFVVMDAPGSSFYSAADDDGNLRMAPGQEWDIYYNTIRAGGFESIIPYKTALEPDNPKALEFLASWEETPTFRDPISGRVRQDVRQEWIRRTVAQHVLYFGEGCLLMSAGDIDPAVRQFRDFGVELHMLNEKRFGLAFLPPFSSDTEIDVRLVNSILLPTLPTTGVWSARRPWN